MGRQTLIPQDSWEICPPPSESEKQGSTLIMENSLLSQCRWDAGSRCRKRQAFNCLWGLALKGLGGGLWESMKARRGVAETPPPPLCPDWGKVKRGAKMCRGCARVRGWLWTPSVSGRGQSDPVGNFPRRLGDEVARAGLGVCRLRSQPHPCVTWKKPLHISVLPPFLTFRRRALLSKAPCCPLPPSRFLLPQTTKISRFCSGK